jgi:pimeloyl-ACP methyl ester carboxylesterase
MRWFRHAVVYLGVVLAMAGAIAVLPGEPISEEPRSMMGSGFVNDWPDVGPGTWAWTDWMDLSLDDPGSTTIVIWNHYTVGQRQAVACSSANYFPPPPIIRLERLPGVRVYYLCTKVSQENGLVAYYNGRRDEIVALARRFVALGVDPKRIFAAGQSGGSTSSALAYLAAPDLFGGTILLAPAWTGMGEGLRRSAGLARGGSAVILDALKGGDAPLVALVAAFENDSWNRPRDLAFLTDAHGQSVEIFSPRCGANHGGAYQGCGVEPVADRVREWFTARLAKQE